MAAIAFNLIAPNLLEAFPELNDCRHNIPCLHLQAERLDLIVDDLFRAHSFFEPFFQIGIDHLLKVVDIVEECVINLVDRRVDITRDSDINEKYRLVFPPMDNLLCQIPSDNEVRRPG